MTKLNNTIPIQYFITHATSRSDKNSLKHVRESKNDEKGKK